MQIFSSLNRLARLTAYFQKSVTIVRKLRQGAVFFRVLRSYVSTNAEFDLYEATVGASEDEESCIEDIKRRIVSISADLSRSFSIDGRPETSEFLIRMAEKALDLPGLVRAFARDSFERAEREAPGASFWYASVYALQGEVMRDFLRSAPTSRFHTAFETFLVSGTTLDLRERVRTGSELLLRASVEMFEDDIFDRTMWRMADDAVLISNVLVMRIHFASLTRTFHNVGLQYAARRVEEARERIQVVYVALESERYQAAYEPLLLAFEFLDDGFMGLLGYRDRQRDANV